MIRFICAVTGLVAVLLGAQAHAQTPARKFCFTPPDDRICPVFPEDQPDFSRFFEYRVINDVAQHPFDEYAWQAFVALNWQDVDGDAGEPGWRGHARRTDVFDRPTGPCARADVHPGTVIAGFEQSDGNVLIDQRGNLVVYETRMNPVAARYLTSNRLTTAEGRAAFNGPISFPRGINAAQPAAALIKTAWQILPEDDPTMIEADGLIPISAEDSADGTARCLAVRLGLIGMHIATKVQSGHGDKWIWATFEHRTNVPTAANARGINSLYAPDLFPDGCQGPKSADDRSYRLFAPDCPDCAINDPPSTTIMWDAKMPFARRETGSPAPPSQIVRCWRIFEPTAATNRVWQEQLSDTPLANYMLISAQWRGANPDPIFRDGELPRYLSNTALETYVQTDLNGTCLGCHALARTSEGEPSDFTYMLR
ncbi:MAG: hypothetical protein AAF367_00900 [Pseudomonadota bacterium]